MTKTALYPPQRAVSIVVSEAAHARNAGIDTCHDSGWGSCRREVQVVVYIVHLFYIFLGLMCACYCGALWFLYPQVIAKAEALAHTILSLAVAYVFAGLSSCLMIWCAPKKMALACNTACRWLSVACVLALGALVKRIPRNHEEGLPHIYGLTLVLVPHWISSACWTHYKSGSARWLLPVHYDA